jgi:putative intracellular protease/amidase
MNKEMTMSDINILMVLTSHDKLGDTGKKTGFWLEEFAAPYYSFKDGGVQVTLASPLGGQPPIDPKSDEPSAQTDATRRFKKDTDAQRALKATLVLSDVASNDFDAVFFPGGHGPLWDLANDANAIALIESMLASGKPVAAVCHAPGVLRDVKGSNGASIIEGKKITGFSNSEEAVSGLTHVVPFLLEDMVKERGGMYMKADDWQPYVITDGMLITGQNPASSKPAAEALLAILHANETEVIS